MKYLVMATGGLWLGVCAGIATYWVDGFWPRALMYGVAVLGAMWAVYVWREIS